MRTYRVFIPVYVHPEDTTIDIDIEDENDEEILDSDLIEMAIKKLIEERPLVPWLIDDTYTVEPEIKLIDSDTPE